MKTIKQSIALLCSISVSTFAFSQLNLGLGAATQATASVTASTAAVTNATNAATHATRNAVQVTSAKALEVKSATTTKVENKANQATQAIGETKSELRKSADVSAGVGISATSQTSGNSNTAGSGQASINTNTSTEAGVDIKVNGAQVVDILLAWPVRVDYL